MATISFICPSFFFFLLKSKQANEQPVSLVYDLLPVSVIGFLILDVRKEGLERLGDFAHYLEASMEFSSR